MLNNYSARPCLIRKLAACLFMAALPIAALAQVTPTVPKHYLSVASTNSTLVYGKPAVISSIVAVNTTATVYYLKLYDTATAPVCGTATPVWTIPIPANATSGVEVFTSLYFYNGVGFCLTGAISDSDTTAAAAGVAINLGLSGTP